VGKNRIIRDLSLLSKVSELEFSILLASEESHTADYDTRLSIQQNRAES
jgi:hypothetical protein